MTIPDDLFNTDLWTQASDTQFDCTELNLKVIIADGMFELRGIADNDLVIASSEWCDIYNKIFEDTRNR